MGRSSAAVLTAVAMVAVLATGRNGRRCDAIHRASRWRLHLIESLDGIHRSEPAIEARAPPSTMSRTITTTRTAHDHPGQGAHRRREDRTCAGARDAFRRGR